jgi:hypothetical protein
MDALVRLRPRRPRAGLAAALIFGLAAFAPKPAAATSMYFLDDFDVPSPLPGSDFGSQSWIDGNIDVGVDVVDQREMRISTGSGDSSTHSCIGTNCPNDGDTSWHFELGTDNASALFTLQYIFDGADFSEGGIMALDLAGYDTVGTSTVMGDVIFVEGSGASTTIPFDLPEGVVQSTPTRVVVNYSGASVDLTNIILLLVDFQVEGDTGSFTVDRISTLPEPAALPLLVGGLAVLDALGRHRKGC